MNLGIHGDWRRHVVSPESHRLGWCLIELDRSIITPEAFGGAAGRTNMSLTDRAKLL